MASQTIQTPRELDVAALERANLERAAYAVAFDEDGALLAARSQARRFDDGVELSDRDLEMLEIGSLAGSASAIARAENPYEGTAEALERVDDLIDVLWVTRLREKNGASA